MLITVLLTLAALAAPAHVEALATRTTVELDRATRTAATWQERHDARLALAWRADPDAAALAWEGTPVLSRTMVPLFTGPDFHGEVAGVVLVDRLRRGEVSTDWRGGLALAAVRAGGVPAEDLIGLFRDEPSAEARAVLLDVLKDAEKGLALAGLAEAMADDSATVRAAALQVLGGRADGAARADLVLTGTRDADPEVRAAAFQAVGWLGLSDLWDAAVVGLADPQARVRMKALRALERLDADRAVTLPEVQAMSQDPDTSVASVARRLLAR
jgi:HEAT repeats